jgi:hypothetical protein
MRRELSIFCMTACLCSPAESQPKANEPAPSDITMADLRGLTIEATTFHQQIVTRNGGQPFPNRQRVDIKFSVTPEDKMEGSILATAYNHGATHNGTPQPISSRLERPAAGKNFGGGNGMWVFQDGTLTSLYVYKAGGAFRREFSFSRTSTGLACTIKDIYAREDGAGPIVWNSSVDGSRMAIIKTTQTSATCKVTKKQP